MRDTRAASDGNRCRLSTHTPRLDLRRSVPIRAAFGVAAGQNGMVRPCDQISNVADLSWMVGSCSMRAAGNAPEVTPGRQISLGGRSAEVKPQAEGLARNVARGPACERAFSPICVACGIIAAGR